MAVPFFLFIFALLSYEMNIITLKNISFSYPSQDSFVFENFSLSVEEGDYIAITGKNGCGKSTLSRIIAGLLKPVSGSVEIAQGLVIALVFQNPKNQLISGMVSRDTAFGPKNQKCSKSEIELRTIESLNITGILDKASSSTMALSLGQTQKVALSGMIAMNPDILILDEALSMLDDESKSDIYSFLDYFHKNGKTIIHITHEEEAVKRADKIISMDGTVPNEKLDLEKINTVVKKSENETDKDEVAFVFDHVSFSYDMENPVLEDVSFTLKKGKLYALEGPSGAGKSTIMETGCGLLKPQAGKVYSCGKVVLCQQNAQSGIFESFAADDVAFGPRNQGIKGKALKERVKSSMEKAKLPFDSFSDRQSFYLSGGEQKRLAIAGILAMDADILFFDEPTCALDTESRISILSMLRELASEGKTVLFSTHHEDEKKLCDYVIPVSGQKDYSTPQILPEEAKTPETQNLLAGLRKLSTVFNVRKHDKKGLVQKLPSWVKILLFLVLFVFSLIPSTLYFALSMFAAGIVYCLFAHFSLKKLIKAFLQISPFLIFFAVFQIMFRRPFDGEKLFTTAKYFTLSPSKLWFCLITYLKTLSSLSIISAFFVSTPEYDLIDGLEILLKPLCWIRIPVNYITLVMEIIFRFIPLLIDEASSIIKTQTIRGGLGETKGFFNKVRSLLPLFVPLIAQTIKRSEALSEALTVRGVK